MISYYQIKSLLINKEETWANGTALFGKDWNEGHTLLSWTINSGIGQIYYKIHQECYRRQWITHHFYDNTLFYDTMKKHWKMFWPTANPKTKCRNSVNWKLGRECIIPRETLDFFITNILLPSLNNWKSAI